jgi:hypothetical protein
MITRRGSRIPPRRVTPRARRTVTRAPQDFRLRTVSTAPLPPRPPARQRRKCRALDRQVLERRGHRSTSPAPTRPLSRATWQRSCHSPPAQDRALWCRCRVRRVEQLPSRFSTRSGMTVWWAEREPTSSSLAPLDVVGHLPPGSSREDAEGKPAQVSLARPGPAAQPQWGRTRTSPGLGRRVVRVGNSEQGCEGRVPCAVSDLVGVGTADDGTTCGADRDAIAQQVGRGTGR